jgi:peptide/nickel transport system permease protein
VLSHLGRRLLVALPTLAATSLVMFAILYEAGDPVASLRESTRLDAAQVARIIEQEGYDDPFLQRYWGWLSGFVTGDWGISTQNGEPVRDEIAAALPATFELLGLALAVAILVALPVGVLSAVRPRSAFDVAATGASYLAFAFPTFLVGLILQLLAVRVQEEGWGLAVAALGLAPLAAGLARPRSRSGRAALAAGALLVALGIAFRDWNRGELLLFTAQRFSPDSDESLFSLDHLRHLVLPVLTLALVSIAGWSRYVRAALLEVMGQDYLRTARAQGLSEGRVVVVHALRNGLLPLITVVAIDAGALVAGAVVTETVFAWPGVGTRLLDAVRAADIPVAMGIVMLGAVAVVVLNLLADVAYALADPRVRLSS